MWPEADLRARGKESVRHASVFGARSGRTAPELQWSIELGRTRGMVDGPVGEGDSQGWLHSADPRQTCQLSTSAARGGGVGSQTDAAAEHTAEGRNLHKLGEPMLREEDLAVLRCLPHDGATTGAARNMLLVPQALTLPARLLVRPPPRSV